MPFRVAGWSGNIFFGFSSLRGIHGEGPVRRGFQAIERAEKWQTFSVTLRKVSMVTGEAVLVLIEEKGFNRRDRREKPECAERNHSKREAVPQQNAEPLDCTQIPKISRLKIFSALSGFARRSLRLKAFLVSEQITNRLFHYRATDFRD